MDSKQLQTLFLSYFESHNHPIIPSSSVVPYDDNTLLFVNSGMVQFKKLFSMTPSTLPYKTATSSQHCIRAGGKHNDLDDVGKDSYHHTFFFMLGNWSFGDYFKEKAIFYAYDFLTSILKLDTERMYVSYYKTDVQCDIETYNIWKKYIPESRILPFDEKDNFWEMGDTGPCGPCTEIHYDCREERGDATHLVNKDHPDVIEIWNIVFIQYFRNQDKSLSELPMKCIDTGMGMERVLRIVNKVRSNYMTDSFVKIIGEIENEIVKCRDLWNTKDKSVNGSKGSNDSVVNIKSKTDENTTREEQRNEVIDKTSSLSFKPSLKIYKDVYDTHDPDFKQSMAMRVIADHSRTIAICLHDGVSFSPDGRGYVLRRIMRRAIKYCNELELTNKMSKFVKVAAQSIGIMPTNEISLACENEEKLFLKTLEKGKKILQRQKGTLSGKDAFMLYDTFGFPFDLTEIYCEENNIKIDKQGFDQIKKEMREMSRKKTSKEEKLSFDTKNYLSKFQKTCDEYKYTNNSLEASLLCMIRNNTILYEKSESLFDTAYNGENSKFKPIEILDGEILYLLFDRTCFYSEGGGQVGDTGFIEYSNYKFEVIDTQRYNDHVLHICKTKGITLNDYIEFKAHLEVDYERRDKIKRNHTATHLLNHVLRRIFDTVEQKGSLVDDKKLRFDFTHSKGLSREELKWIEGAINDLIKDDLSVTAEKVDLKDIDGKVIYLKEEKYPEKVRVVSVDRICAELCGGTHVGKTGEIKRFRIMSEGSVSNNIRRIVAYTHEEARKAENNLEKQNPHELDIPWIEKIEIIEREKLLEKARQENHKQIMNNNILRLKEESKHGSNTTIKCQGVGLIFECSLGNVDRKQIIKDLNLIGSIMDKENICGIAYVIADKEVYFAVRGDCALERGKLFCKQLKDGSVNGKDRSANGKGKLQ